MAATDYYVTTTGAGTKSGLSWANAFSIAELKTDIETLVEPGDRYFIKEGTHTLTVAISTTRDGNMDLPVDIIGVTSGTTAEPPTSTDWATGANRPLFDGGAYTIALDDYWQIRNVRFTGTATNVLKQDTQGVLINCYIINTSASTLRYGWYPGAYTFAINCEFISTNGYAIFGGARLFGCYMHDSAAGINNLNYTIIHCIVDTCTTGVVLNSNGKVFNSTIYNCTTGLYESNESGVIMLNNVIDTCVDGFKSNNAGTIVKSFYIDYNNWSNNTRDMSWDNGASEDNSFKGLHDTAVAPAFTDAPNGDFSLGSASGLIDAGFSIELGVG